MPDGVNIPGGPSFAGTPQPPDVPCDPTGEAWRGEPGPVGPMGPAGPDGNSVVNVLDHGAKGDGVTNDYNVIQSVLNSQPKATIYFPDTGQPYMVNGLLLYSNSDLLIHGTLKLIGGSNISLMIFNNASNISIRGHGVLDGNGPAQSIAGAGTLGGNNNNNIQIEGLTIQNAFNWNLNITRSTNVRVDRVRLLGGTASNEFADGCNNCWITNSYIDGPTSDGGFTFYGGVTNSGMTSCIVTNSYACGVAVYSDYAQPAPCFNVVIANNIIHNCQTGAITVDTDSSPAVAGVVQTGVVITGNRCYNNLARSQQYGDIWIGHGVDVTVTGNNLSGSGMSTATAGFFACGIFIGVTASYVNITGNTIWNEGNWGSGTGYGIYIQQATDVLIEANHIYDNLATHRMIQAISGNAGARNAFIGNLTSLPSNIVVAGDTVFEQGGHLPLSGGTVTGNLIVNNTRGISYDSGNYVKFAGASGLTLSFYVDTNPIGNIVTSPIGGDLIGFQWVGSTVQINVDGSSQGNVLTVGYAAGSVITFNGVISNTSVIVGGSSGPSWTTGSAAPAATAPVGSLYSRVGGAVGSTLYVSRGGGAWNAVSGV